MASWISRAAGRPSTGKSPMRGCVPGRFRGGPVYSMLRSSARSGDNPGPASMARGINKVILVGNLGNDPETKYTQGGMAITTLSLATTSVRKDKDGQQIEKTEWHRVKLFGKVGEIAGEYLKKGRQVYIEGRIEYGSYEKDGVKHYTTDIIGDEMQMLGGQGEGRAEPRMDLSLI